MKITRIIALAVIAASAGIATVNAQSLRNAGEPAEFPPASYKSTQYVDSKGCVFVRAGISGNVTWIPRVTRARKQVCGQQPSLQGVRTAAAAPPKAAKAPVQITLEAQPVTTQAVRTQAAAAKPRKVAAAVVPVVKPRPVARRRAVQAVAPRAVTKPLIRRTQAPLSNPLPIAKPKVVRAPVARRAAAAQPQRVAQASACRGVGVSQAYRGSGARHAVRCGPQAQSPYSAGAASGSVGVNGYATGAAAVSSGTRFVPKHVAVNRINSRRNLPVPKGYRKVWEDDRLNPHRAEQTVAGHAATQLIWTNTVPRRLIDRTSGRDVTQSVPLIYPYLDTDTQTRELGQVNIVRRAGQVLKQITRNVTPRRRVTALKPRLSTRSVPTQTLRRTVKAAAVTQPQFVNVGTYRDANSAQSVAKKVRNMGMPVRIGKFTRAGQTLRIVLAGPFKSGAAQPLNTLRRAGYSGAKLRN